MSDQGLPDDILSVSVRDFIAATAAKTPTPGGGSVAAVTGALAASLAEMAMHYTLGKKQFEAQHEAITGAIEKLRRAAGLLQELVEEDVAAYQALSGFLKQPAEQRQKAPGYLPAVVAAVRAPESVGGVSLHILELCQQLVPTCNRFLLSDLGAAAALAHATVHVAQLNVLVNLRLLPNPEESAETRKKIEEMTLKADMLWHKMREALLPQM